MKKIIIAIVTILTVASCKKKEDKLPSITATVQQQSGCLPNTWLVLITNGDGDKYSFLCKSSTSTSSLNCSNAVYIANMPAAFAQIGKKIKFTRWSDRIGSCLSSLNPPHHLDVSDISED